MKRLCVLLILPLLLVFAHGCGYQLGLVGKDTSVRKVYCYTVKNQTRIPGAEMPLTNAIIHALQHYGEHVEVVKNKDEADTFLFVILTTYDRAPARFNEADFLQQSSVTAIADMALYRVDVEDYVKRPPKPTIEENPEKETIEEIVEPVVQPFFEEEVSANVRYFIGPNQPEGENSVRPELYDKLARAIVDKIVNRWVSPSDDNLPAAVVPVEE